MHCSKKRYSFLNQCIDLRHWPLDLTDIFPRPHTPREASRSSGWACFFAGKRLLLLDLYFFGKFPQTSNANLADNPRERLAQLKILNRKQATGVVWYVFSWNPLAQWSRTKLIICSSLSKAMISSNAHENEVHIQEHAYWNICFGIIQRMNSFNYFPLETIRGVGYRLNIEPWKIRSI